MSVFITKLQHQRPGVRRLLVLLLLHLLFVFASKGVDDLLVWLIIVNCSGSRNYPTLSLSLIYFLAVKR